MTDLRESVENIVERVKAEQRAFDRSRKLTEVPTSPEPDSRVVTRDIILKVAEKMEERLSVRQSITRWLRSQASDSGEPR